MSSTTYETHLKPELVEWLDVLVLVELAERVDAAHVDRAAHDAALRLKVGPVQAKGQTNLQIYTSQYASLTCKMFSVDRTGTAL